MKICSKSKYFLSLIAVLLIVTALGSCIAVPNNKNIPNDGVVYSPEREVTLTISDENADALAASAYAEVYKHLFSLGITAKRLTDAEEQSGSEIAVGSTDRAASLAAQTLIAGADPDGVAFALCYKEGALAITAVNELSWQKAMAVFYELAFGDTLRVDTDYSYHINKTKAQYESNLLSDAKEQDEYEYEHRFDEVAKAVDSEGLAAIRALYNDFLGEEIYLFYASLFDPVTGAYYFSESARNYEGFLPDLESTYQIFNDLQVSGMLDVYTDGASPIDAALPSDMKQTLITWVQGLQDSGDGYFYHPQWGSEISVDRQGRDLGWAISILEQLGAKPLYPTALDRLSGASAAAAVSKVIAAASNDHLKSEEAFRAWLYSYRDKIIENSHGNGHIISAQASQIVAAGYGDIACDFFDDIQTEIFENMKAAYDADPENSPKPTGLWQYEANYTSLAGLYKIGLIYSAAGRTVNYLDYCVDSAITVIASDEKLDDIVDVYNPWAGLNTAIGMMKKANGTSISGEVYDIGECYGKVRAEIAGLLDVTFEKMLKFRKDDGSFSYNMNGAPATMYSMPSSLGVNEGDVNATHLMVGSMCSAIFSSLGVERPKTWSARDYDVFLGEIEASGEIVKLQRDVGASYDFEDGAEGDTPAGILGGEIVFDPKNNENKVLAFNSSAGVKDSATFNAMLGSGYVCAYFESRILLKDVTHLTAKDNIPTHQVRFAKGSSYVYMLTFTAKNGKLVIGDNSSTSSGGNVGVELVSVPLDEWCDLRVEIYSGTAETFRVKIYVNGRCLVISENFYGSENVSAEPKKEIGSIVFYGMEKAGSTLLIDDFEADTAEKTFSDDDYEGERETNEILRDFEDGATDFISVESTFAGSSFGVADDPEGDGKVLELTKTDTSSGLRDHYSFKTPQITSDTLTVSFDLNLDYASSGGIQIALGTWGRAPYLLYITAAGSGYKLGCTRNTADTESNVYFEGGELSAGWHNIEMVLYITDDPDEFLVEIYIDGELLAESADYYYGTNSSAPPSTSVPEITFKLLRALTGKVYIDNLKMTFEQ